MVTTYDIAKCAGLNQSTVSRVLSGGAKVRTSTARKVWDACKALNYVPNVQARGLKTQRTMTIAIHMPQSASTVLADPFVPAFLSGVSRQADHSGYSVILSYEDKKDTVGSEDSEQSLLNLIRSRRADGLILTSPVKGEPMVKKLIEENVPFVTGRVAGKIGQKMGCVDIDNFHSGYQAGLFLMSKGIFDVALISEPRKNLSASNFLRGLRRAMMREKVKIKADFVKQVPVTFDDAYSSALELIDLKNGPRAIVVTTALTVFGALEAVRNRKSDVLVLGVDSPLFSSLHPDLPRIVSPIEELGARMAGGLIEILTNGKVRESTVLLKNKIVDADGIVFMDKG